MFGLSNVAMIAIGVLLLTNIVTFGMYRWSESDFEREKVEHKTTKLKFDNYKTEAALRETKLMEASLRATQEGEAKLKKAEENRKAKEKELNAQITKLSTDVTISADLIRVLNSSIRAGNINGQGQAASQVSASQIDGTGGTSGTSENILAGVVSRNYLRCEATIEKLTALQDWARQVCTVANCI